MKITLKGVPPSLNQTAGRKNRWDYIENKKEWTRAAHYACKASPDRPQEPFPKAMVRIDYFFKDARRHDADNYSGKYFMDGLTTAGVIKDDDLSHISVSIHGHIDRKNPRTEITVVKMWEETE